MKIDTRFRTTAGEIMDDFTMEGEVLREALDKIAAINRLLGGNKLTLQGVQSLLSSSPLSRTITVVDIGCGNGDMLRTLADYAEENDINFKLIGIDANQFTINHAENLTAHYPNISYKCVNIFDQDSSQLQCDIVLCTLTLHHFSDDEIIGLVRTFVDAAQIGVVINDLHRHIVAYRLFQVICTIFRLNKMSREDGLVSILRGFKLNELVAFSKKLQLTNYSIKWRWAFRYEWIIRKL